MNLTRSKNETVFGSATLRLMVALHSVYKSVSVFTLTYDYLKRSYRDGADTPTLKRDWAADILTKVGVSVEVIGEPSQQSGVLFLGNHISYLDIPLLMNATHNISFVAKEEVRRWPVIGSGARAINTIFVKRSCGKQRAATKVVIAEELLNGARIALFPAGTTCMDESKAWRRGAFEIAKDYSIAVQPFRIRYTPLRTAAYIGRDFFPLHLYQLAKRGGVVATLEFHPLIQVADVEASCQQWQAWSRA